MQMKKKLQCSIFKIGVIIFLLYQFSTAAIAAEQTMPQTELAAQAETAASSELTTEDEPLTDEPPTNELLTEDKPSTAEPPTEEEPQTAQPAPEALSEALSEAQSDPETPTTAADTKSDTAATAAELINWLESHQTTGGTVTLTDNIVLDGAYYFCPSAVNLPHLYVDADRYTITVTGEITFFSDAHLTFYGQEQEKGIFRVAKGGLLFLENIIIEGMPNALWQEEDAGLVVKNCRVSGNIRYADKPFVTAAKADCVLVEKGQTAKDVLPAQIQCTVNCRGELYYNEPLPVSWNLETYKTQQKKRLRFAAQGTFLTAASKEPLSCIVAYHDYPLTFLDVKAVKTPTLYWFRGEFTKPGKALPIRVAATYSFDQKNWITYEEKTVSDESEAFFIGFEAHEWDTAKNPYAYIRLHWNDNGKKKCSNVLRYHAADLSYAEDQGGSRGGGTSIVNPPDEPHNNAETKPSDKTKPNAQQSNPVQSEPLTDTQHTGTFQMTEPARAAERPQTADSGKNANDQTSQKTAGTQTPDTHETPETPETTETTQTTEAAQTTQTAETTQTTETTKTTNTAAEQPSAPSASSPLRKTAAVGAAFAAFSIVFAAAGVLLYRFKKRPSQ